LIYVVCELMQEDNTPEVGVGTQRDPRLDITFSGNPLDRINNRRKDEAYLKALLDDPSSVCCAFSNLQPLVTTGEDRRIVWLKLQHLLQSTSQGSEAVLLGVREGVAHYVLALPTSETQKILAEVNAEFTDMRRIAPVLPFDDAAILAQGRALLEWHAQHQYCGTCGHKMRPIEGGTKRQCTNIAPPSTEAGSTDPSSGGPTSNQTGRSAPEAASPSTAQIGASPSSSSIASAVPKTVEETKVPSYCGIKEYPRTNPVVIMLVISADGSQCLLGRQARFPPNLWTCLAGFMDAGETVEEAVRREVYEESGVRVGKVTYFASQPWPYGSQLMIGCFGEAISEEIHVDTKELEAAQWFSVEQVSQGLKEAATSPASFSSSKKWRVPPPTAIANRLVAAWVGSRGAKL
jgi:NADH pyrophosphatase NudC (nudix superfamily)